MKYVVYLRVSTDQQVDSGLGLDAQRKLCLDYISKNGACDYLEFIDEGYSGALSMEKRPNLILAVDALDKDDVLLVAKRDRLGRDIFVNAMIERSIERKQAFLVSASGDFKHDNDPSSILMRRMIDAFAEYERLIIGARTKAALQIKKSRNERIGHIPYGYKLNENKINLDIDEIQQSHIELMFELREEGYTLRELAAELERRGIRNKNGNPWTHVSLLRILRKNRLKFCLT